MQKPMPDRMPPLADADLTPDQRDAANELASGPRGAVFGPFVPLLRSPELMRCVQKTGEYLRYNSALPPRLSEFVILLVARWWNQDVEWQIHHPIALKAGVKPAVADAIAENQRPAGMSPEEEAIYDFLAELHRHHKVGDATYARANAMFGERGVVDLTALCGYYSLLAMVMNVAQTSVPEPGDKI